MCIFRRVGRDTEWEIAGFGGRVWGCGGKVFLECDVLGLGVLGEVVT